MGRKKKLPLIENLEITAIAAEGKSIGKVEDMVVFVPGVVPGDVADVQVTRKKKKYMEGFLVKLRKKSDLRSEPFCSHFGTCGGCRWQNLPYEQQLKFKQQQVVDHLTRIGKVSIPEVRPIIGSGSDKYYRNKLEYTFSKNRWLSEDEIKTEEEIPERRALGFHMPGKFDRILNIDTCYLQDDLSNKIRNAVRKFTLQNGYSYFHHRFNNGLMRNLMIRNTTIGEWMVVVVFYEPEQEKIDQLMQYIRDTFPQITSLMYMINTKVNDTVQDLEAISYSGRDHIFEELMGLRFKIGPKSFFQTNSAQTKVLYQTALDFAQLMGDEIVYDLYTGTGTIAAFVARHCRKVLGIEYVEDAIHDARVNATLNSLDNVEFFAGDMKTILTDEFLAQHGSPRVIITDPPRAGMHADVVNTILKAEPQRIVYVSCNPATQARDIQRMSEDYQVTAIQPVDMFPHTHHVENVVCLERM